MLLIRGSTLIVMNFCSKPLHYDDNGITGPDWGRSEVVFSCFPPGCFHQPIPLCDIAAAYSSHHRFSLCAFIIAFFRHLSMICFYGR